MMWESYTWEHYKLSELDGHLLYLVHKYHEVEATFECTILK